MPLSSYVNNLGSVGFFVMFFSFFFNESYELVIIVEINVLYAYIFVSSGQDIQGTSVVANLPVLMRQNPAETLRRVLPKIRVSYL